MPLLPGAHVGRYEILSPIGKGGMGEVYRARDPSLGREVAVKVVSGDEPGPERLERFEHEARAVAALRHPHILDVHDVGVHEGRPYIVLELLEGETLGQRLARGPLSARKAVELATQLCAALAAAHARGILHRDLKPDNLFLAPSGLKVLDFGIAKLLATDEREAERPTETVTERGGWLGTPGYVSPEQLCGQPATTRSDIFALGAVLYETLTGRRAFDAATRAETLSAILGRDPPAMTNGTGPAVPPALERIVRRCLEKDPDERFQSARDVAYALEALSGSGSESASSLPVERRSHARRWLALLAGAAALATVFVVGALVERKHLEKPLPTFRALTFRRGWMSQARFAPDGRTVVYSAAWDGQPPALYEVRTDSVESRPLGLRGNILSISADGMMAFTSDLARLTLALAPIGGLSAPRPLLDVVYSASWMPDGRLFVAVLHETETTFELPPGNVVGRWPGAAQFTRVSPDGRYAVFRSAGTGSIVLLDIASGARRTLLDTTERFFYGLAWTPSSREVWYSASSRRDVKDILAVDLAGRTRTVYRSPTDLAITDIGADGRVLVHRTSGIDFSLLTLAGEPVARDVSVGRSSVARAISADGRTVLVSDFPRGVFVQKIGQPPVRLGDGSAQDLSFDGSIGLILKGSALEALPVGGGLPRTVETGMLAPGGARCVPPGCARAVVWGVQRDDAPAPVRVVSLEAGAGSLRATTLALPAPTISELAVSPDGRLAAGIWKAETMSVLPLDGGAPRDLGPLPPGYYGVRRWSEDGRSIFITRTGVAEGGACTLARFDVASARIDVVARVAASDSAGVVECGRLMPSADGKAYAAAYTRCLTDLLLVEGLQ